MITIKTEKIKAIASKIGLGVDNKKLSPVSELLELEFINGNIIFKVTNKEYFLSMAVKEAVDASVSMRVTLMADDFLKLVSKLTTEDTQLDIVEQGLVLISNSKYTFPLILDGSVCAKLPEISFNGDLDCSFEIDGAKLKSILDFNGKELQNQSASKTIQKYYYWDNKGALTFIEGACINDFDINAEFKLMMPQRLVSLFKLFNNGSSVKVDILKIPLGAGYDKTPLFQNKIRFMSDDITIVSLLPDDSLVCKYPEHRIRSLSSSEPLGEIILSKADILNATSRLMIFENEGNLKNCGELTFSEEGLSITSVTTNNLEIIPYKTRVHLVPSTFYLNLSDLIRHVNITTSEDVALSYGMDGAIRLQRGSYTQVIPEVEKPAGR